MQGRVEAGWVSEHHPRAASSRVIRCYPRLRREEATRDTPIIVISGHATVEDAVHAIKLGASDFFEKPLARERVLVSVRNVLEAAKTRRALAAVSLQQLQRYEMIGRSDLLDIVKPP